MKIDYAYEQTDKMISDLEKKLKKEYSQAAKEVEEKMNDYLRKFEVKDKKWSQWVKEGKKTKQEYAQWRKGQMISGKRWGELKDKLAKDYNNTNKIARKIINGDIQDVYALNINFATYHVEHTLGVDTSFTLYNHEAVERLVSQNPDMLPPPGKKVSARIRDGKDVLWNKQTIQSVMTQGILQGESIPNLAHRLAYAVGDKNYKSAIRNARTMATWAQNSGRHDAFDRARDMGCLITDYWVAIHDNRTRTSHRHMDREPRGEDGYFSNGLRDPGDPTGDPAEVYNCRCGVQGIPTGFEENYNISKKPEIMGMSYDEWLNAKPVPKRITSQAETGKRIKQKYISEYRRR